MKNAILTFFLCAATSAVCQSTSPTPLGSLESGQAPPTDFGKLPSTRQVWNFKLPQIVVRPEMTKDRRWDDARIDPKIITHPSQSRLGVQPPGIQVAQNEYPNLLLLPIDLPGAKVQITPTQWPSYRLKAISTRWPKFKLLPVDGDLQAIPRPPAK